MKPTIIALSSAALLGLTVPTAVSAKQITPKQIYFDKGDISSGSFSDVNIKKGDFSDFLTFSLSDPGQFGASLTSVAAKIKSTGDVDFTRVFLTNSDGVDFDFAITNNGGDAGLTDSAGLRSYLTAGDYTLTINGHSYGNGQFGGNTTFIAAVPELQTWAMLIVGMGMVGGALRVRRRPAARVSFG